MTDSPQAADGGHRVLLDALQGVRVQFWTPPNEDHTTLVTWTGDDGVHRNSCGMTSERDCPADPCGGGLRARADRARHRAYRPARYRSAAFVLPLISDVREVDPAAVMPEEPESPEGKWVTIPVPGARKSLLYRIDSIRGEHNRSEWMRMVAAEITLGVRKPNGELRAPGATAASLEAAAKSPESPAKRPVAAAKTVTPALRVAPAAAFQEPAEPERRAAQCPPHPKGRVTKKFCGACGRPVGDEAVR